MRELARFTLADGGEVIVEVDPASITTRVSRRDDMIADAKISFERALGSVRDAASSALGQFRSMVHQPDEVEIKFAVKLSATAGAVIAKTTLDGQLEVKLKWMRDPSVVPLPEDHVPEDHVPVPQEVDRSG